MTNHKKGSEHWTSECKRIREERDSLLLELTKGKPFPVDDKLVKLLREIYDLCGSYYANFEEIREKIKKSGLIK